MKERPILYSAPMVRAILEGRKTQTRRIVKNPEWLGCLTGDCPHERQTECDAALVAQCPYGVVGDRLWGRETIRAIELPNGRDGVHFPADGAFQPIENSQEAAERWGKVFSYRGGRGLTVPGIHMPRWSSRILTENTEVRVQRLQDISEDDALAEGIVCERVIVGINCYGGKPVEEMGDRYFWGMAHDREGCEDGITAYAQLWDHINGKGAWDANPWVWAVSFRLVAQEAKAA